jgi:hypothetical protein
LNLQLLSPKAIVRDVLMYLPALGLWGGDGSNVHNMLTNPFFQRSTDEFLGWGVSQM